MIITDKQPLEAQWYVIMLIGILSLTDSEVIMFYVRMFAFRKDYRFIFEMNTCFLCSFIARGNIRFEACTLLNFFACYDPGFSCLKQSTQY